MFVEVVVLAWKNKRLAKEINKRRYELKSLWRFYLPKDKDKTSPISLLTEKEDIAGFVLYLARRRDKASLKKCSRLAAKKVFELLIWVTGFRTNSFDGFILAIGLNKIVLLYGFLLFCCKLQIERTVSLKKTQSGGDGSLNITTQKSYTTSSCFCNKLLEEAIRETKDPKIDRNGSGLLEGG